MQSGIWLMGRMVMDMVLSVENAEKYYGREPNLKKALDRVDFEVSAGEFVSIMGSSGSGRRILDSFFRILICWIPSALRKTLHCRWQSRIFRRKR